MGVDIADPFKPNGLSFEEYRSRDVICVNDGAFFDALDEMFGIVPGTDELIDSNDGGSNG